MSDQWEELADEEYHRRPDTTLKPEPPSLSVQKRLNVQAGRPVSEGLKSRRTTHVFAAVDHAPGCPNAPKPEPPRDVARVVTYDPNCGACIRARLSGRPTGHIHFSDNMTKPQTKPHDVASEPDFEAADEVAATMAPMVAKLTRENAALKAEAEKRRKDPVQRLHNLAEALEPEAMLESADAALEEVKAERDEARAEAKKLREERDAIRKISICWTNTAVDLREKLERAEGLIAAGSWCCGVACRCPLCEEKRAILRRREEKGGE